jgi:AcrR family transcriptional regulator
MRKPGESGIGPNQRTDEFAAVSGPDVPAKTRRSDQTRARIVDAAEEVFGNQGYHGASVVEITKKAGIGLGTFYLYFPSKIEVYRHLLRTRQDEFIQAARDAYESAKEQRTVVQGAFGAFFDWIARRPKVLRLMREAEFVDPALLADIYQTPATEFRERLARAMELGYIEATDPDVLAWCLMGMAEFTTLRWIVWSGDTALDPERFDAFVQIMTRTLGVGEKSAPNPGQNPEPNSGTDPGD